MPWAGTPAPGPTRGWGGRGRAEWSRWPPGSTPRAGGWAGGAGGGWRGRVEEEEEEQQEQERKEEVRREPL